MNGIDAEKTDFDAHLIARTLAIITGALLLRLAFFFQSFVTPLGDFPATVTLWMTYGVAFVLLGAAVADVDFRTWNQRFAGLVLITLSGVMIAAYITKSDSSQLGTDGILFARYSVDLLLAGQNPFSHSMGPAFEQYPILDQFVTYKMDGSIVTSLSYPALSVLVFLPQAILGIPNLNLTTVVVFLGILAFLTYESPWYLRLAPFVVLFADPSLIEFSFGGVFDIIWVLPLLIGMRYWARNELRWAALWIGLAFAVKQTPWFIGPFLAVWLYNTSQTMAEFRSDAQICIKYGLFGFLLPNIPFIIWDPHAWVSSVLTPVAGGGVSLVQQGSGIALISVIGVYPLSKTAFTVLLLGALGILLVAYAIYFDQFMWFAWIAPAIVLFFNYRSLQNYFIFFIPIAYYTMLLKLELTSTWDSSIVARSRIPQSASFLRPIDFTSRRAAQLVVAVLLITASASASVTLREHESESLDVTASVDSLEDPHQIGKLTTATVTLTNHESAPIEPEVSIIHGGHTTHAFWNVTDGPAVLQPGETTKLTISATITQFAIPYGTPVVFGIVDTKTERVQKLDPIQRPAPKTRGIWNPSFAYWEQSGIGNTQKSPAQWAIATSDPGDELVNVTRVNSGVQSRVSNVTRTEGPWAMSGVTQTTPLPETIHIEATPESIIENPVQYPPAATGIEIADRNRRVWVVFANVSTQTVVYRQSGDLSYALVYVPAEAGKRLTTSVNVSSLYDEAGWERPDASHKRFGNTDYTVPWAQVLLFAADYPGEPNNNMSVTFHNVTMTPPRGPYNLDDNSTSTLSQ